MLLDLPELSPPPPPSPPPPLSPTSPPSQSAALATLATLAFGLGYGGGPTVDEVNHGPIERFAVEALPHAPQQVVPA
jgi:hypothetical protein